jgi:hypothetical protein
VHPISPVQVLPVPVKPGLQVHTGVLPELVQVASGLHGGLLLGAHGPAFEQQQARVEAASQPHDGRVCRVSTIANNFFFAPSSQPRHQDPLFLPAPQPSHH